MKPAVIIYRENLLSYSETFVLNQAEALRHFCPYYVGTRRVEDGLAMPPERTLVINNGTPAGRLSELWFKASGLAPRLDKPLHALHPQLIHAHFGSDGIMALPLSRRLGVPLITTFHGFDATMHDEHLLKMPSLRDRRLVTHRPQLIREGAMIIAVSEHIRQQLLAKGFAPERVVRHYNGIDPSVFSPATEEQREPLILFVGRLVEKKGGEYLLRAMQSVQQRNPTAQLIMIGEGQLRGELGTLAEELRINCRFVGRQTPAQVRQWMQRAQVFCLPSVTAENGDTEGLPTVILEALATNLPVVATISAGNPEAVRGEQTGLLVPERDVAALAGALSRLLEDAGLRRRLGRAGLADVRQRFDARRLIGGLEALYQQVIAEASAPARRESKAARSRDTSAL